MIAHRISNALHIPHVVRSTLCKGRLVGTKFRHLTSLSSSVKEQTGDNSSKSKGAKTPAELLAMDLPSNEDNENLLKIRHSSAHVMAMAVQKVFPHAKVTIGPWIDNG